MPLLHLPLLAGLILIGLPVLLHLLMRQKPKHILFPAFRFLQQKAKTNQRKIRLRHLLLLLLRMALIALLCFALATLRGRNQVGAVILVVDTSPSMEYSAGGKTRLDEAKARALEVLNGVSGDSRVAVLDPGDPLQQWTSIEEARDRVNSLVIRPGAQPITSTLASAYRLFAEYQSPSGESATAVQRHLYIFSDRTMNSWEPGRTPDLQGQQERLGDPAVSSVFVDVGADKPIDIAISNLEVKPAAVPANLEVNVKATITATGQGCDTEVLCKVIGASAPDRKSVKLAPGQTEVIEFPVSQRLPKDKSGQTQPGEYQAEVTLVTTDALPGSNARFVTFEVRGARKVLAISDEESYTKFFRVALEEQEAFACAVKTPDQIQTAEQLREYTAVCLLSVARPKDLWGPLTEFVNQGGHLLVVPGRDETQPADYRSEAAQKLLPGVLKDALPSQDPPAKWGPLDRRHVLLNKIVTMKEREPGFLRFPREARRYWEVTPAAPENRIINFDGKGHPALLERLGSKPRGSGRVVMLTTPIDFRPDIDNENPWNNYAKTTIRDGFYVVLVNALLAYMAGDLEEPAYNFNSGQVVALPLLPAMRFPEYTLDAPGVTGAETRVVRAESDADLPIRQTNFAGNARVNAGNTKVAAFSLNPPGVEFNLERLPAEEIDKLFGPDSVVTPATNKPLSDALGARGRRAIDFFPWLMLGLVALLVVESIVANRFYKPEEKTA